MQGRAVHRPCQGPARRPYDGHTLATIIPEIETQVGASLARIVADRGYRGHNAPPDHKLKVYISGQKRGVTETIKRDLRRLLAVEPIIGHAKNEHRMGRNFLKGTHGDAANAVLAAAGYNFRRLLGLAGRPLACLRHRRPRGPRGRCPRLDHRRQSLKRHPHSERQLLHGRLFSVSARGSDACGRQFNSI